MRLSLLRLKYPALRNRRALLRYAEQATSKFHATVSTPSATVQLSKEALRRPILAPWARLIQKMVEADADLPRRLQVPARAIWRDLQINHGYTGCYNVVQEFVRSLRRPEAAVASSDRRRQKRAAPITAPVSSGTVNPPQAAVRIAPPPRFMLMEPVRGNLDFETAEEWMKALQHGALSSEILSVEIPSLPIEQIEKLRNTGLCAPLPMRKRAMAMLSYLRGVRREQFCSFLGISLGSFWRYWRVFRRQGADALLVRKVRSDKQITNEATREAVFALLHAPPSSHGVNRTSWTMPTLESVLRSQGFAAESNDYKAAHQGEWLPVEAREGGADECRS